VTSLNSDAGALYSGDEGKDDALHALIEYTLGEPDLSPRDASEDRRWESSSRQHEGAKGFEREGRVLHFAP
jgi:hypothetical protein